MRSADPGETLKEAPGDLGITPYRLAQATGLPPSGITSIIKGRQGITAATALRFGQYFDTPPKKPLPKILLALRAGGLCLLPMMVHAEVPCHVA